MLLLIFVIFLPSIQNPLHQPAMLKELRKANSQTLRIMNKKETQKSIEKGSQKRITKNMQKKKNDTPLLNKPHDYT